MRTLSHKLRSLIKTTTETIDTIVAEADEGHTIEAVDEDVIMETETRLKLYAIAVIN